MMHKPGNSEPLYNKVIVLKLLKIAEKLIENSCLCHDICWIGACNNAGEWKF